MGVVFYKVFWGFRIPTRKMDYEFVCSVYHVSKGDLMLRIFKVDNNKIHVLLSLFTNHHRVDYHELAYLGDGKVMCYAHLKPIRQNQN